MGSSPQQPGGDEGFYVFGVMPLRKFRGILKKQLDHITGAYRQFQENPQDSEMGGWLLDNFYILEKEWKQAILTLQDLKEGKAYIDLVRFFYRDVCRQKSSINQQDILRAVQRLCAAQELTWEQFIYLESALRCALLQCAARALDGNPDACALMKYAVNGLHATLSVDFEKIRSECSEVERILSRDPSGVYKRMDGDSKSEYRRIIAQMARKKGVPEIQISRSLLGQAQRHSHLPENHIGYYIINHTAYLRSRQIRRIGRMLFLFIFTALFCGGIGAVFSSVLVSILCILPVYEVLRLPADCLFLKGLSPSIIPRMDFDQLPCKEKKTIITVTLLLETTGMEHRLKKRLRDLYYGNQDEAFYFCILADLPPCPYPHMAQDDSMMRQAVQAVQELNKSHGGHFLLYVRPRTYSQTQNAYIGEQRKRGAIEDFVRYLKGDETQAICACGDFAAVRDAAYLLALDSDTHLLLDTAKPMIAAAAHPVNRPRYTADGKRVIGGYGAFVPRVKPIAEDGEGTRFSRLVVGNAGISGYGESSRCLTGDLYGQAIFTGKGLLDVDCYYRMCAGAFPPDQVLSHDILEGGMMGCGFLHDTEIFDSEPRTLSAWLSRMHRWIRGDWQNLIFIPASCTVQKKRWHLPLHHAARIQLLDNLRRSLTPIAEFLCVLVAVSSAPFQASLLCSVAFLSMLGASLYEVLCRLIHEGAYALTRRYFGRILPQTLDTLKRAAALFITLPVRAITSADAIFRALWRTFFSRKKLLEWTTAAQCDKQQSGASHWIRRYLIPQAAGIGIMLFAAVPAVRLFGLAFCLIIPFAIYTASKEPMEQNRILLPSQKEQVREYAADMLRYFLDTVNAKRHWLVPDNIQFSPRYAVAERTSPTNIGFMLLSFLAARDLGFISTEKLYEVVNGTVSTLETLGKWHGNLYNWYDTQTLRVLEPSFVSAVDSGNLVACLIALRQGLLEYSKECPDFLPLSQRIGRIIGQTQLDRFYDPIRRLFSIGYDCSSEKMSTSHYDFLMSEARMLSYCALGRREAGRRHWGALERTMSRTGRYLGPVSWTGTMFEYFMPHLLLPVFPATMLDEALRYGLYCQKRSAARRGVPWGISESGYYAFDSALNYQYKAHGVQSLGVKRGLENETVVSPYSSFLALPFAPQDAMKNLSRLRALGLYADYGFYEAVDFTPHRVGNAGLHLVRSFMAHHIGMSMAACANALLDGIMQRRFMRDPLMGAAEGFLKEKLDKGMVVYDKMAQKEQIKQTGKAHSLSLTDGNPSPQDVQAVLYSNGALREVLTNLGTGFIRYADEDCTRKSNGFLEQSSGIFCLCRCGSVLVSATKAPFYGNWKNTAEFTESSALFTGEDGTLRLCMQSYIPGTLSASIRKITIYSEKPQDENARILLYFEPTLMRHEDFDAHVSFSRLFVTCGYDKTMHALHFTRRLKEGGEGLHLLAGFLEDCQYEFETDKPALLQSPQGISDLHNALNREFSSPAYSPNAVCAVRVCLHLHPKQEETLHFVIAVGKTKEQAQNILASLRRKSDGAMRHCAVSPLLNASPQGSLGLAALPHILFHHRLSDETKRAIKKNKVGKPGLWALSISGDFPIVVVPSAFDKDPDTLIIYAKLLSLLRSEGAPFDLVILARDDAKTQGLKHMFIQNGFEQLLFKNAGIFLINQAALAEAQYTLLLSVACMIAGDEKRRCQDAFHPVNVTHAQAAPLPEEGLHVYGGAFHEESFVVGEHSGAPYCHILANPVFGTLVSDKSLGFTWYANARENKLTPWTGDAATDNRGERLVLQLNGLFYDPICGSRASFSRDEAVYRGICGSVQVTTRVHIASKGCAKRIEVELYQDDPQQVEAVLAYYMEPVLGVNRETSYMITGYAEQEGIVMQNFYNSAVSSAVFLSCSAKRWRHTFSRQSFLSGAFSDTGELPCADPCCAIIVPLALPSKQRERIQFVLSAAKDAPSARLMAKAAPMEKAKDSVFSQSSIHLHTPEFPLNAFFNTLLSHQVFASRLYGRTAFYQCSGAYGFRDQLQDAMNVCLLSPADTRIQIARCCAVQFEQGDVLHWWHALPGRRPSGVRTGYSDDLLWLPLAIAEYCLKTGDNTFLQTEIAYLHADELKENEHDRYFEPEKSIIKESVFHHGLRALERGYRISPRGLVKIGAGDWNDGFNRVGEKGKGESVWLSLFTSLVCTQYAGVCDYIGASDSARTLRSRSQDLKDAVERYAWDGEWYARATFDNGDSMGVRKNSQCRIDSLPQSFAAIAGMPDKRRVDLALDSAWEYLVDEGDGIVKLFDPPFINADPSPGYVQAYPKGIRENGGQYTHAAVWLALGFLKQGDTQRAMKIINILNPAFRSLNKSLAKSYRLEPYYIAADIYTNPAYPNRGGWSIYTGAAGWYWRTMAEDVIGLHRSGGYLEITPSFPSGWQHVKVDANICGTQLEIGIMRMPGIKHTEILLDGKQAQQVPLDGRRHKVSVHIEN